ncbi:cyclic nucleotide-binding domain-containing protein [Embleya sp. NBC_00896]|uniref:Crp/Fnr family transcriptional regulator n=1 Tax=Embleya sp. NBC_00896 TaxID=2975961 RepID=UPI002F90E1E7|nr:cyclic nucleotide-binding domain-containing protein [Embleya sp. NBC_00896]
MIDRTGQLDRLPAPHLSHLLDFGTEVVFAPGARIFEEGSAARQFWLLRSGSVALDMHVPGRHAVAVERLGPGDLLGWAWLFPPHRWHMSAESVGTVHALQFEAGAIRAECERDPEFGYHVILACARVVAERLQTSRLRILELYGPHASDAP